MNNKTSLGLAGVGLFLFFAVIWFGLGIGKTGSQHEEVLSEVSPQSAPSTKSKASKNASRPFPVVERSGGGTLETRAAEVDPGLGDLDEGPEKPVTLGAMSRESIDEALEVVKDEVDECYREALEEIPDLEGILAVKFMIAGTDGVGRVAEMSVIEAEFDDMPLEDCLLDAIEDVDFPAPIGGGVVFVNYPFVFSR